MGKAWESRPTGINHHLRLDTTLFTTIPRLDDLVTPHEGCHMQWRPASAVRAVQGAGPSVKPTEQSADERKAEADLGLDEQSHDERCDERCGARETSLVRGL